jgi:hypothetical protein
MVRVFNLGKKVFRKPLTFWKIPFSIRDMERNTKEKQMNRQTAQAKIKSLKLAGKVEKEFDARQATSILIDKITQVEKVLTESLTTETKVTKIEVTAENNTETEQMTTFTYNDSNYSTISETEWLFIAQAVAEYVSGGNYTLVEYEPQLRPYDAALIAVEEANYYVDNRFYKYSWKNWLEVLTTETKASKIKVSTEKQDVTMTYSQEALAHQIEIGKVLAKSGRFNTAETLKGAILATYEAMVTPASERTVVQKVVANTFVQIVIEQKQEV